LDNQHWMRMAGRLSRRVRTYAMAHPIPLKDGAPGSRSTKWASHIELASSLEQGRSPLRLPLLLLLLRVLIGRIGESAATIWWRIGHNSGRT
jgi:hypothetical protein